MSIINLMDNEKLECFQPDFELIKDKLLKKTSCSKKIKRDSASNCELFNSFYVNDVKFRNHFAFINLNDDMFYDEKLPNDKFEKFYLNIAKSGVGLIVTGGCYNKEKLDNDYRSSSIDIETTNAIKIHKEIVNKIHSHGAKIFLQLKSIYGRGDNQNKLFNIFEYSSSYNFSLSNSKKPCVRISDGMCTEIAENFGKIATFSKIADYDGILINGDMFNILGEFTSKEFNRRIFGYYSNLDELPIKILKEINNSSGNINIFYSITLDCFLKEIYKSNIKNINSTCKIASKSKFKQVCELLINLVKNGVDGFIFRFGTFETEYLTNYNQFESEDLFFDFYNEIKDLFKRIDLKNKFGNSVSVIYADNFNSLDKPSRYYQNGMIDFVDVTRHIYSDNDYLNKIQNKKLARPCIKCGHCNNLAKLNTIGCLVNPNLYGVGLNNCSSLNKNIAVVGGGTSGIICANILAKRGYNVDIFEKNNTLNKNGRISEVFKFDDCLTAFNDYIETELLNYVKISKVKIYLNQELSINVSEKDYRSIVIATGFHDKLLDINGSILKNVKNIYDVLANQKFIENINKITMYVKSELSLKLALFLLQKGKKVSIIIPNFKKFSEIPNDRFCYYLYQFKELKAVVYIDAKVRKIHEDFVEIVVNDRFLKQAFLAVAMNLKTNSAYSYAPKLITFDSELFIYEPELYSNNKIYYELVNNGYTGELYMIGSALQISTLAEDIKSAYFVAKNL